MIERQISAEDCLPEKEKLLPGPEVEPHPADWTCGPRWRSALNSADSGVQRAVPAGALFGSRWHRARAEDPQYAPQV